MARPVGSIITAETLVKQQLLAWLKINDRIRRLLETQLSGFEKRIQAGDLSLDGQLSILSGLKDMLITSTRTIEGGLKLTSAPSANREGTEDPDAVAKELAGGRG